MYDVFLSYTNQDRFFVENLIADLRHLKVDVFYDKMLPPGSLWAKSIDECIEGSDFFIPVITDKYLKSAECLRQLKNALDLEQKRQQFVIPALMSDCELPPILQAKVPADFSFNYDEGLNSLLIPVMHLYAGSDYALNAGSYLKVLKDKDLGRYIKGLDDTAGYSPTSPKVFLCHANEDKSRVEIIYFLLGSVGINPWYDKEHLIGGDRWEKEILIAIEKSDYFVIFFSNQSVGKRGFIQNEIKIAIKEFQNIPENTSYFIPVRLDQCDIPDIKLDSNTKIADLQWIDLPENKPSEIWKLVNTIKSQWKRKHKNNG